MTKKLVVSNNKGGVGKTFISSHVFYYASEQQKSCYISLDTQESTQKIFDDKEFTFLKTSSLFEEDFKSPEGEKSLVFIGDTDLLKVEKSIDISKERQVFYINLSKLEKAGYEFIVLDTPPAEGELMKLGLLMADHAVIPFILDTLSIEGIKTLVSLVGKVKKVKPNFNFIGLLPNRHQKKSNDEKQALTELLKDYSKLLVSRKVQGYSSPKAIIFP